MHAIFALIIAVYITKKKVSASVEQLHEPVKSNKRPQQIRAIRSWLLLLIVFLAVAVIVWVTINYYYQEAIVPLTHELIVYEKRPTANGQELLLLPWILVFFIFLLILSKTIVSDNNNYY